MEVIRWEGIQGGNCKLVGFWNLGRHTSLVISANQP